MDDAAEKAPDALDEPPALHVAEGAADDSRAAPRWQPACSRRRGSSMLSAVTFVLAPPRRPAPRPRPRTGVAASRLARWTSAIAVALTASSAAAARHLALRQPDDAGAHGRSPTPTSRARGGLVDAAATAGSPTAKSASLAPGDTQRPRHLLLRTALRGRRVRRLTPRTARDRSASSTASGDAAAVETLSPRLPLLARPASEKPPRVDGTYVGARSGRGSNT